MDASVSGPSTSNFQLSTPPPGGGRGRLIAIGDIHGCADEFEELLSRLAPTRDDVLVLLGDLVNRGPASARVIALARRHAQVSLLGNHELRLLEFRRTGDPSHLRRPDHATLAQLGPEEWAYLEAMPLTAEAADHQTVFVHGGFLPGRPWREQPARVVTRIQVVGPDGKAHKRADFPAAPHWSELWMGPPFVVYGHTPRPGPVRTAWTLGIDTACVQGGALTAVVLPERRLVQVRSRTAW
jgi:serine/threonine protein phosphatase 1